MSEEEWRCKAHLLALLFHKNGFVLTGKDPHRLRGPQYGRARRQEGMRDRHDPKAPTILRFDRVPLQSSC